MKYIIALLMLCAPFILSAEPIHRCVDHQGQLSFQRDPCPDIEAKMASFELGDHRPLPSDRRATSRREDRAEGRRVQSLLQEEYSEKNKRDEKSLKRCLSALRAARMCGRFAGMFSCGKHGFQREEPSVKNSVDLLRAVKDGGEVTMSQCVQQVSE